MKKFIILAFVCLLVSTVAAYATGPVRFNQDQEVKIFNAVNRSVSGHLNTQCTSSLTQNILRPGARILGYTVTQTGLAADAGYFAMYDASGNPNANSVADIFDLKNLEAEVETGTGAAAGSRTLWFPYPYLIKNGVIIRQGPNSVVTIYYEIR